MDKQSYRGGMGLASVLTLVFIVLKLVGVIGWNWLLVISPILLSLALTLLITIGALIITFWGRKK